MFWSFNVKLEGAFDKGSVHGSCSVQAGTKGVATKWIRDKPMSHRVGWVLLPHNPVPLHRNLIFVSHSGKERCNAHVAST